MSLPIRLSQDGNMRCATFADFINLMESPVGFGATDDVAVAALLDESPMRCTQAMWWGYGAPAGLCGAVAYGPNYRAMENVPGVDPRIGRENSARARREWVREARVARCPNHGGPTRDEAVEILLATRIEDPDHA